VPIRALDAIPEETKIHGCAEPFAPEAQVASGASQGVPNWVNMGASFLFLQPRPHTRTGLQCTAADDVRLHQHDKEAHFKNVSI
jgi:hypothetical protein